MAALLRAVVAGLSASQPPHLPPPLPPPLPLPLQLRVARLPSLCLQLTKNIVSVTTGMDAILGGMDIEKIANVMDKFEKQFETLDVRSSNMERSIASSTATSVPEDEVDDLMGRVKAANDIKTKGGLVDAGSGALGTGVGAAAAPGRVAEAAAVAPAAGPGGKPDDRGGPPPAAGGAGGPSGGGAMGGAGGGGGGDSVGDLASRLAALRR